MENRPEFVATWLGLSKIGVVVPLINHNLKKQSLLHSITISNCNALIFGESLVECKNWKLVIICFVSFYNMKFLFSSCFRYTKSASIIIVSVSIQRWHQFAMSWQFKRFTNTYESSAKRSTNRKYQKARASWRTSLYFYFWHYRNA